MAGGQRENPKKSGGGADHRVPRVEKQVREVVGRYLIGGFRGNIDGIISVTRVIVSGDLRTAKILVTLMGLGAGQGPQKKAALKELNAHAHEVQREVNHRLQLKHCPKVTFFYDEGFDHAMKVENILREISEARALSEPKAETSDDDAD